ncbi:hypothetical protein GCM10012285_61460 [Streptomyces kronopolitis]|uniref:Uncharacterized protein n=1 Tax=Streptomyces kronopolitis TaxID=1612435 RepID=A0ABQ2K2B3_9ACTN|nr:hypothetical protein GCM10012285_61460 [Streptomyces kronopolitis]
MPDHPIRRARAAQQLAERALIRHGLAHPLAHTLLAAAALAAAGVWEAGHWVRDLHPRTAPSQGHCHGTSQHPAEAEAGGGRADPPVR